MDKKEAIIVEKILRLGAFGVFLGHGFVALGVNKAWIPLLTSFGFTKELATGLLPIIGVLDIIVAFLLLLYPMRIVLIWAFIWALLTALTRPIAGYPIWSFVERSANWAIPLALIFYYGMPKNLNQLFKK